MKRIAKDPQERKKELIEAAEALFLEKGYEQTSVGDIVKKIRVAQGTFYYHFKSKSDALQAVVEKNVSEIEQKLEGVSADKETDPAGQVNEMINGILQVTFAKKKLLAEIHRESNAVLHDRLMKVAMERLSGPLSQAVERGVAAGRIRVPYPVETVELILAAMVIHFHDPEFFTDAGHRHRVRVALEHILTTVLGVKGYAFHLEL